MAVAIEHLLPIRAVPYWWGLGYWPLLWIPLVNCSLHSARVDQATFSSESSVSAPKGMTAPTGMATRNSQLQCTVLTFPTSSFTSYVGTPSVTWWATTYSVSLH